jgi:hypothetical protein
VQFKKELTADFEANKIMKIYKTWPRVLAIVAHYYCSQAAPNFRRIELSNNKKETKALHKAAARTLLNCNIRATAALFHLGQEMVRLQAIVWGVDPFRLPRKIKHNKLENIDGKEIKRMPRELRQAVRMAKAQMTQATIKAPDDTECARCQIKDPRASKVNAIFRNREKLDAIISPEVELYEERNLTTKEAGILNGEEMQRRNDQADAQIKHPAQGNIAQATNIKQLRPEDVYNYIDYSKSKAALHDYFKTQTGIKMEDMIPNSVFTKSLKRIELVDFKGDRESLISHWIHPSIRKDFDIFFRHFRDKTSLMVSKRFNIPDHPPLHYF